jgi:ribosomal-protein-alanine N-acetyltransferase
LAVAAFNERAIKVYKRMGAGSIKTFMNITNGGVYGFLEMIADA